MRVRDLLRMLEGADPDAPLLHPSGDHGYRDAWMTVTTALLDANGHYQEDHGDQLTPGYEGSMRVPVVVVE
ncbi:hypothetical protein PUR29_34950 [Methylobacterium ajmalii]|uniref:Uncharacterized protein n=1 Tax=Methylobacterium ajmalii TaxID=2738439 RepID=A0ABV0A480_9HYPH